ncbi:MAG: CBS domain-containing protein [Planctomycetota bacterium]
MGTSQTDIETQVIELATDSFNTFCEDISGMFGVNMRCEQKEVVTENVSGLKKRFSRLVAVNVVESKGALDGTFHVLFDQEGLFTIGGVIVMLPEVRIMENRKSASGELAASMVDAVGEAGNLLVGTWDRVFRDGLKRHGHFLQRLPAFIGKPWDNSEEKIGLAGDEEFTLILYEMTVASYPAFACGVVFPKQMLGGESGSASDEAPADEKEPEAKAEKETKESKPSAKKAGSGKSGKAKEGGKEAQAQEPDVDEAPVEETDAEESSEQAQAKVKKEAKAPKAAAKKGSGKSGRAKKSAEEEAEPPQPDAEEASEKDTDAEETLEDAEAQEEAEPVEVAEEAADSEEAQAVEESDSEESQAQEAAASAEQDSEEPQADTPDEAAEEKPAPAEKGKKTAKGNISEAIRKMAQSPAILPGESVQPTSYAVGELFSLCAADIMQDDVTWAEPEDSVQQALSKMQQNDTGYIMIGRNGVLEGIASRSDVTGAISPYLRSVFAKWRRPLDDATLKIKVKWIMSRPVRTVTPETSLAAVMENMCRFGGRAIPVVDEEGQVRGLVTVFDILQMLLHTGAGVSTVGKTPQEPPLA